VKELPHRIYEFLVAYDFPTILEEFQKLEWKDILRSGYTWMIVMPILVFLLWTKKFKIIISLASFVVFMVFLKYTLAPTGESVSLHNVLIFVGGAAAMVGLNLYLLFIRD
jgi:hypothetical protein